MVAFTGDGEVRDQLVADAEQALPAAMAACDERQSQAEARMTGGEGHVLPSSGPVSQPDTRGL
jgi:hypothetical protein